MTVISVNCGFSVAPCPESRRDMLASYLMPIIGELPEGKNFEIFGEYLSELSKIGLPCNFGSYFEKVIISSTGSERYCGYIGRSLSEIADLEHKDEFTCFFDMMKQE